MKLLCFILVLHTALASTDFGRAYMRKSKLCHQWICINNKLNLPDGLPPKEDFSHVLQNLLPPGSWQEVVENVVEACYNNRSRRYTNTCPGQALLHCAVDQLMKNCPVEFTKPHDGCAPVNSLAGFGNMFTQSQYKNMDTRLQQEARPTWYLKNYFKSACCDVPLLFNSTVLSECGFTEMLAYYNHRTVFNYGRLHYSPSKPIQPNFDPLDCCDLSDFIQPSWRQECDFKLSWNDQNKLVIDETMATTTTVPTTTSERPVVHRDVMLLPQSCEKETCVFKKLGILSDSNIVNIALFTKLLDNFTSTNPGWERAKGRAITTCLNKPLDYDGECEINRFLTCVFDLLTENCPTAIKDDPCKHTNDGRICQISSSKYRPKHRRGTCNLPELVNKTILNECGLSSLSRIDQVNQYNTTKKYKITKIGCKDITPSTSCVLTKMGVLNKYGFMDYFKMNNRLENVPRRRVVNDFPSTIINAVFKNAPRYKEHCNSPRKFLNLLETMVFLCPSARVNQAAQCSKLFEDMRLSLNKTAQEYTSHYQHAAPPQNNTQNKFHNTYSSKIVKKPLYNYGLLNSKYAPKVETIDLTTVYQKPLVLLPVYMRVPNTTLVLRPHDSTLRGGVWLQNLAQSQVPLTSPIPTIPSVSTLPPVSTISPIPPVSTSPVSTATPIFPTPVTYIRLPNSNLLIRSDYDNLLHRLYKNSGLTQTFEYSTISTTSNEPVSTTSTNEPVSTTSAFAASPVFTERGTNVLIAKP